MLDFKSLDEESMDVIFWQLSFTQGICLLHEAGYPADNIPLGLYGIEGVYDFYEAYTWCVCKNLFGHCSIYQIDGEDLSLDDIDYELSEEEILAFRDCTYSVLEIETEVLEGADCPTVRKALDDFRTRMNSAYWGEIYAIMSSRIRKDGTIMIVGELLQINPSDLVRGLIEIKRAVEEVAGRA